MVPFGVTCHILFCASLLLECVCNAPYWYFFRLRDTVQQYIEDTDPDSGLNVGADMRKINECFRIFKVNVGFNFLYFCIIQNCN